MIVKWKTQKWGAGIERVECTRETAQSVWALVDGFRIGGPAEKTERKALKRAEYEQYHDTWEKARDFLIERETRRVEYARTQLEQATAELSNVKGLKAPA